MATDKQVKVTTIPILSGDTVASYNVFDGVSGTDFIGTMTPTEGIEGKVFGIQDGVVNQVKTQTVWSILGNSSLRSNAVVVDLSNTGLSIVNVQTMTLDVGKNTAITGGVLGGIYVTPNGTKLYVHSSGAAKVYQYDLLTAYDISTASFVNEMSTAPNIAVGTNRGIQFSDDGKKMLLTTATSNKMALYNLATGFDISTADAGVVNAPVLTSFNCDSITFADDGLNCYATYDGSDTARHGVFSTAWDITGVDPITWTDITILPQNTSALGNAIDDSLTQMLISNRITNLIEDWRMVAGDISTLTFNEISIALAGMVQLRSICRAGNKLYVGDSTGALITQYSV